MRSRASRRSSTAFGRSSARTRERHSNPQLNCNGRPSDDPSSAAVLSTGRRPAGVQVLACWQSFGYRLDVSMRWHRLVAATFAGASTLVCTPRLSGCSHGRVGQLPASPRTQTCAWRRISHAHAHNGRAPEKNAPTHAHRYLVISNRVHLQALGHWNRRYAAHCAATGRRVLRRLRLRA